MSTLTISSHLQNSKKIIFCYSTVVSVCPKICTQLHTTHCCFVLFGLHEWFILYIFYFIFFFLCSGFFGSGGFAFLDFSCSLYFLSDFVADAGAAACCRWLRLFCYCYLCRTVHRIFNYYIMSSLLLKNAAIVQNRGYDS